MLTSPPTRAPYDPGEVTACVRAERCLRVGRDQAALQSVLGSHIADFPLFLPDRENSRP